MSVLDTLRDVLSIGPVAWVWIVALVVTLVSSIGVLWSASRVRSFAEAVSVSIIPLTALVCALLATVALVQVGRGEALLALRGSGGFHVARGVFVACEVPRLSAVVFVLLVPLGVTATAAPFVRLSGGGWRSWLRTTAVISPMFIAATAAAVYGSAVARAMQESSGWARERMLAIDEAVASAGEALGGARLAIIGVGLVGSVAGVLVSQRERRSPVAAIAAASLFAAGLTAFVATRAHEWDAEHPLPVDPAANDYRSLPAHTPRVAERDVCVPPSPTVLAERFPDGTYALDGRELALLQIERDLVTLRRNYFIMHPDARDVTLLVAASADTALADLAPFLAMARDAGYTRIELLYAMKLVRETKTIGAIELERECAVGFSSHAPPSGTVAEVIERATASYPRAVFHARR